MGPRVCLVLQDFRFCASGIQALCVNLGSYYRVVDFRFCASGIQALRVNSGSYYIVYALYISTQYMCACVYQVVLVCI